VNGALTIESALGKGTRLRAEVPLGACQPGSNR
jgi:hypothetical protein